MEEDISLILIGKDLALSKKTVRGQIQYKDAILLVKEIPLERLKAT